MIIIVSPPLFFFRNVCVYMSECIRSQRVNTFLTGVMVKDLS